MSETGTHPSQAHPVRLRIEDDLRRSRLTVFFRLLLAIPHLIWLFLWSLAAIVALVLNWLHALATGRPADSLHRFLSAYIRYSVHVRAYLWLVANPYPAFNGTTGYLVDVELPAPVPQARWATFLRLVLALPALLLAAALGGGAGPYAGFSRGGSSSRNSGGLPGGALLGVCAFLGWFVGVVQGRMPRGLRDAGAYSLGYSAQALAYLLLITDRYPDADPAPLLAELVPPEDHPVRVDVQDDLRRSRVTVFFRLLLVLPHLVWWFLWAVALLAASIANWFVAVVRGRPADPLHRFAAAFVRYAAHLGAYFFLVANPFPGFTGARGSFPFDVELPPSGPQPRAVTFFRIFLVVPAALVSGALSGALALAAIFMWFTGVLLGRAPRGLRNLGVYALRYNAQANAYLYFVTARYPHASPLVGGAGYGQDQEWWTPPQSEAAPLEP